MMDYMLRFKLRNNDYDLVDEEVKDLMATYIEDKALYDFVGETIRCVNEGHMSKQDGYYQIANYIREEI
jgi:hypothetical protein